MPQRPTKPRSTNGRLSSAGSLARPPSAAFGVTSQLAGSRRTVAARAVPPSTAATSAKCTRGDNPWASAPPPASEPSSPPMLNIPCSDDITGLPRRSCTATPWAFIATSRTPSAAPKPMRASPSETTFTASAGRIRARQVSVMPSRVMGRLPYRATSWPATGLDSSAPTARQSSASPRGPVSVSTRSLMAGMRSTQLPNRAPLAKNTTATAIRACRGRRASKSGPLVMPRPRGHPTSSRRPSNRPTYSSRTR